jgi:N-acetylgalactosamine-N,N'-diacetylbacillosaminyl-diphospho-undecaprenol 4-alpha-N-acetylgalactosaminyltransferase
MRVAFLINSLGTGGAETIFETLTNGFVEKGIYPHILLLEKKNEYQIDSRCKITYLTPFNKIPHLVKLLAIPFLALRLNKYCNRNNIGIVMSHLYRSNYVNILSNFKKKRKTILINQGTISRYKVEGILGKVNLYLIKHLYKRSDVIVVSTSGMYVDMQNLFHFKNEIKIIYNPNDIVYISKKAEEEVNDFDFRPDIKYIISVGRLVHLKRIDLIIKALKILIDKDYKVNLIIIGEGPEEDNLRLLVVNLNLLDYVHFLGRKEKPFKYMANSTALVLSSESEGMGNVLIEALASSCPTISSDCNNGPREILAPDSDLQYRLLSGIEIGKYGILFSEGSIEALVEALDFLLLNSERYIYYKNQSINRANAFNKKEIIQNFINLC